MKHTAPAAVLAKRVRACRPRDFARRVSMHSEGSPDADDAHMRKAAEVTQTRAPPINLAQDQDQGRANNNALIPSSSVLAHSLIIQTRPHA